MFKFSTTHVVNAQSFVKVNTDTEDKGGKSLIVNDVNKFFANDIVKIRKATPQEAAPESIKFAMPALTSGANCRLYLYIRTTDASDPLYANDKIYKGKPFSIEFEAGASAAASAANLVANSNKWLNFVFGRKVLSVTASDADVTISVVDGNNDLRFYKVEVQEFVTPNNGGQASYADGEFQTKAGWSSSATLLDEYSTKLASDVESMYVTKGNSGFGTYMYLLKNLRLPTNANALFYNPNASEMPMAGVSYVQYIITCCTDRPEVQGISVIGLVNQSRTTHVLWVPECDVTEFEGKLTQVHAIDETYPVGE